MIHYALLRIHYALLRFFYHFGIKRRLHNIWVAIWMLSATQNRAQLFDKIDSAMALIEKYAPEKLKALQLDASSILVAGVPTAYGTYFHKLRMIELQQEFLLDAQTTPKSLACLLIHEAQHARLRRLGFGIEETIRSRIEKLCFRAQRNFARLLPNGDALVAEAEAWMESDPEIFSNESRRRREMKALRELGCPDWIIMTLAWLARRRDR